MVWGVTQRGHDHDIADYEIYLWRVGDKPEGAVRLTYHSGNDRWPDIFIPGSSAPAVAASAPAEEADESKPAEKAKPAAKAQPADDEADEDTKPKASKGGGGGHKGKKRK
jgi:hypothetical protein